MSSYGTEGEYSADGESTGQPQVEERFRFVLCLSRKSSKLKQGSKESYSVVRINSGEGRHTVKDQPSTHHVLRPRPERTGSQLPEG